MSNPLNRILNEHEKTINERKEKLLNATKQAIQNLKEIDRQTEEEYWNWVTQENLKWFNDKK